MFADKQVPVTVERGGQRQQLTIVPTKVTEKGQSAGFLDMDPDTGTEPVVVSSLDETLPAASDGVKVGDWITSVNDKNIRNVQEMKAAVTDSKDGPIKLAIDRNGEKLAVTTHAGQKDGDWRIGVGFDRNLLNRREPVGVVGAAAWAADQNLRILRMTGQAFGQVGTGERSARDTVSGPDRDRADHCHDRVCQWIYRPAFGSDGDHLKPRRDESACRYRCSMAGRSWCLALRK